MCRSPRAALLPPALALSALKLALAVPVLAGAAARAAEPELAVPVSRDRLLANLEMLPVKRSALGDAAHSAGLKQTEEIITAQLKEMGYEPVLQEFRWAIPARDWGRDGDGAPPAEPTAWNNIIVEIRGHDLAHEVLLIGAHFDAVPDCPGADDNGTGTAGLLELARVLAGSQTRRTVRMVFFNVEEAGMIGSTHYVKEWSKAEKSDPPEQIIGMVSMEMLGYFSDEPGSQKSPIPPVEGVFEPPTVGDNICIVGIAKHKDFSGRLAAEMRRAEPALKVTLVDFLPVPVPDMLRSDNRPFLFAGLPAVMLTDTSNFRNPNYHKPTDTIDTLDMERYTLVVSALAASVLRIAEPFDEP